MAPFLLQNAAAKISGRFLRQQDGAKLVLIQVGNVPIISEFQLCLSHLQVTENG